MSDTLYFTGYLDGKFVRIELKSTVASVKDDIPKYLWACTATAEFVFDRLGGPDEKDYIESCFTALGITSATLRGSG